MIANLHLSQLAVIALGSNLGPRRYLLRTALELLERRGLRVDRISSLYETAPAGPIEQPFYLNAVCILSTRLSPFALLTQLQLVETALGRVRSVDWGPRRIDLDLVSHGESVLESEHLTLPHPHLPGRRFVLQPLAEVWPGWKHPRLGASVETLLKRCSDPGKIALLAEPGWSDLSRMA